MCLVLISFGLLRAYSPTKRAKSTRASYNSALGKAASSFSIGYTFIGAGPGISGELILVKRFDTKSKAHSRKAHTCSSSIAYLLAVNEAKSPRTRLTIP
jgi:hypothetical protein